MSIVVFMVPYYPYCQIRQSNFAHCGSDSKCFATVHCAYTLGVRLRGFEDLEHRIAFARPIPEGAHVRAPSCADSTTGWSIHELARFRIATHGR